MLALQAAWAHLCSSRRAATVRLSQARDHLFPATLARTDTSASIVSRSENIKTEDSGRSRKGSSILGSVAVAPTPGSSPFYQQGMVAQLFPDDSAGRGATLYVKGAEPSDSIKHTVADSRNAPHVHHATASRVVKGEDVLFVHPLAIACQPQSLMYMVCDGHSGVEAANFVASNFLRILNTKLPSKLPNFSNQQETETFAENVRKALCETFVRIDNEWSAMAHFSGTTVTVILSTGWLLTTANTGDSSAVLDTGMSMLELIKSHRIHNNLEEQARLRGAGQYLAPLGFHLQGPSKPGEQGVGPLRLWPGGLCVSRSVGDLDAGAEVVPVPHIRQLILPREGCRVIMASDGLWDVLSYSKALKMTRSKPTGAAASTLITAVSRDLRTLDDASIVVIDLLPSESTSFPTVALRANPAAGTTAAKGAAAARPAKKSSGGLFACFKSEPDEPDSREVPAGGTGHLTFLCDVDCLVAYPGLKQLLARTSLGKQVLVSAPPSGKPVDYTMHGAGAFGPRSPDSSVTGGADMTVHQIGGVVHGGITRSMSMQVGSADTSTHFGLGRDNTVHSAQPGGLYA